VEGENLAGGFREGTDTERRPPQKAAATTTDRAQWRDWRQVGVVIL